MPDMGVVITASGSELRKDRSWDPAAGPAMWPVFLLLPRASSKATFNTRSIVKEERPLSDYPLAFPTTHQHGEPIMNGILTWGSFDSVWFATKGNQDLVRPYSRAYP